MVLYDLVLESRDYPDFILRLKSMGIEQTPDGVFWADRELDYEALAGVFHDLQSARL